MNLLKLLLVIVIAILPLTACASDESEKQIGSSKPYTVWFSNPREYRTNILSVAQAETPFSIILPEYLPEDINPTPHFGGRAKNEFVDNEPVTVVFKKQKNDSDLINIEEFNVIKPIPQNKEAIDLVYLDTRVVELESSILSFSPEGKKIIVPIIYYSWNWNGLHFDVSIEYERDEARKIIESMLK